MAEQSLKDKTVKGGFWSGIEQFSTQFIQFVYTIILARLLSPDDYGVVALTLVFFNIAYVIIDSGFATALIRKPDRTEEDLSTCFYFNLGVAFILYLVLFLCAPLIAGFYGKPILVSIIRVSGITLIIKSLYIVQNTQFQYRVDFKSITKVSLTAVIVSGCSGVFLAYKGFGVWSIVWQNIIQVSMTCLMMWALSKWRPSRVFSRSSFNYLFGFGSKLMLSYLIGTVYENLYSLFIGKVYTSAQLGLYNRAETIGKLPSSNISTLIQRVTFPVLSLIQNDADRLRTDFKRVLRFSVFIVFPLMMGLSAVASPLIRVLLTEKWDGSVLFLEIICFSLMMYPIHALNLNLLQILGRSDLFLKLEIIKRVIGLVILLVTVPISIEVMCYGMVLSSLISVFINTYYSGKLLAVGPLDQLKDMFPIFVNATIMYLAVRVSILPFDNELIKLVVGIVVGVVVYTIGSQFFSKREFKELVSMLRKKE